MFEHDSVLKNELVDSLQVKADGTYVDCTLGGAGHFHLIGQQLNESGLAIGFDQDLYAIESAKKMLETNKVTYNHLLVHANFRHLKEELLARDIKEVDGIIFDLGVSSPQLDDGERGFSYRYDAKLDMRMNKEDKLTAYDVVNKWSYSKLVGILFSYGEEKFAKQIARQIERAREERPIETTFELIDIIKEAIPAPARRTGGHPAKRSFQAIRIAVNDELNAFVEALHQAAEVVKVGGRISVITFHSLEDRLCKQAFKKWSSEKPVPRGLPIIPEGFEAPFKLITRKPILPTEEEVSENRRSRSAMLRIIEKVKPFDDDFRYEEGWKK